MLSILRLRFLGTFTVIYDGKPISGLQGRRLQSLLASLVLHPGKSTLRQQIAFQFWPETTDAQAQTNLRQLLHTLRQRLPHADRFLEITSTTIGWHIDAPCQVDVADFRSALAQAQHSDRLEQISAFARAVDLYAGDLLPNCYDDWILPERERLAQQYLGALEWLIGTLAQEHDYSAAIAYAQRLLRYDPLHEGTYIQLMQIHAATGDRATALRVYHTCASLLEQELGVEPSAALREWYERMLDAEETAVPTTHIRDEAPFVGRREEWQHLHHLWSRSKRGTPHFACIIGEPGIGKTRLAKEMIRWAQQQGIVAIHTRAYGAEGELSYAPLAEVLDSDLLLAQMRRLEPIWLAELARIYPDILALHPEVQQMDPSGEPSMAEHHLRLFEALARVFLGDQSPTIFVLDDLQWCDRATLEWLHFLLRYDPHVPLLVIGTLRPGELMPDHPAAQMLLSLRASEIPYTALELDRLNAQDTAQLAAAVAERALTLPLQEAIYQATEGNPLFVVESVRAEISIPSLGLGSAEFQSSVSPLHELPSRVQAVLGARLAQLSAQAREITALAAVIGRMFTFELLAAASKQDESVLVRSLDELWQRRIVRAQGASSYDFSHDGLREVAYSELSPIRRQQLHRRVAQALETTHSHNLEAVSAQLAYHYEQIGEVEQAIRYFQQAAGAARQRYDYQEAIRYLNSAIALMKMMPATKANLERELELQMELCREWVTIKNHLGLEVEAAYVRALELCRQLPTTPHLFTTLWGLHSTALYRGDFLESVALSEECLHIANELQDQTLLLQAYHALWGTYGVHGDHLKALDYIRTGLAYYQPGVHEASSAIFGRHDPGSCATGMAAQALWNLGFLNQAAQKHEELIHLSTKLTQPINIIDSYTGIAFFYHLMCAPTLAKPYAEKIVKIATERNYPGPRSIGLIALGWSIAMQGQVQEGFALMHEGMTLAQAMGQTHQTSQFTVMLAEVCILAGRPSEAIEVVDHALAAFRRFRDVTCAPDLWILRAEAMLALHAPTHEVTECYSRAISFAQELGSKTSELRAAIGLCRLWQYQDQREQAYALLAHIYGWFTEGFDTPDLYKARQLLEQLSLSQ